MPVYKKTKWKGLKSMNIWEGYKIMYQGSEARRNGSGIVRAEILQEKVVKMQRKSDLLMKVGIALGREQIYMLEFGCTTEKKKF